MYKVAITGCRTGCNTVAAIKEIREKVRMPLNEAAEVVNRVLHNEQIIMSLSSSATAQALVDSLDTVGLIATISCE